MQNKTPAFPSGSLLRFHLRVLGWPPGSYEKVNIPAALGLDYLKSGIAARAYNLWSTDHTPKFPGIAGSHGCRVILSRGDMSVADAGETSVPVLSFSYVFMITIPLPR